MRIFFVGDFVNDTGPGIANKILRKGLGNSKNYLFSDKSSKIGRVLEIVIKTIASDSICFCSFSQANKIGIRIAKLFNKKIFYIMHGYAALEKKYNKRTKEFSEFENTRTLEKYIFENSDKIFCVSKMLMDYMKNAEPEYVNKFDYNYNGIDFDEINKTISKIKTEKKQNQIISIGGGMKLKNNLTICKAIALLNKEKGMNLKYVVVGLPYTDKEEIVQYDFVTYYEKLPHEKVLELMKESNLYIQNSSFETFGLSVIESIIAGCNLLISNNIGAKDVIEGITKDDIIFDTNDEEEIAAKISNVMVHNNSKRLKQGLKIEELNYTNSARKLISKIEKTFNGK